MSSARLLKILAASVGGGLVLGAGIRFGEAMAAQYPALRADAGGKLAERLGDLENRLFSLEGEGPAAISSRVNKQAAEVSAVRSELNRENRQIEALGEMNLRLRSELQNWLADNLNSRMAEVELRLRAESERSQKHMLDAFAESVQTRVIQRISRLEEEVAGQSAAMSELRECSLRTEKSMHKLLGGLDKLIVRNPPAPEQAAHASPAGSNGNTPEAPPLETSPQSSSLPGAGEAPAAAPPPEVEPPVFAAQLKSKRWKIFG
jgi:hypothetical protein